MARWSSKSGSRGQVSWWRKLWNLSIPPKVKMIIWRACLDWIPTYHNLRRHGVPVSHGCPSCGGDMETSLHALWCCPNLRSITKKVWNGDLPSIPPHPDVYSFLCECMDIIKI